MIKIFKTVSSAPTYPLAKKGILIGFQIYPAQMKRSITLRDRLNWKALLDKYFHRSE